MIGSNDPSLPSSIHTIPTYLILFDPSTILSLLVVGLSHCFRFVIPQTGAPTNVFGIFLAE